MIVRPKNFPELPSDWEESESSINSADGLETLFVTYWKKKSVPVENARTLLLLHGLGEYGLRYLHLPFYLHEAIDQVVVYDHRGHGRSTGVRGHVRNFNEYVEDAVTVLKSISAGEVHVLGHSMGGLILLRMLQQHPRLNIRSVTLTSPLLGIKVELPITKKLGALVLSRVWGKLLMKNEIDPSVLSHDHEVVRAYQDDRLVHSMGTPSLYTSMLDALKKVHESSTPLNYPIQFLIALEDQIVDSSRAVWFYESLKTKEKRLVTYSAFFHEILNELKKDKPLGEMKTWIQKHAKKS